jgi:hypothetical protein
MERRFAARCVLTALLLVLPSGCAKRDLPPSVEKEETLAERIDGMVERFLFSGDDDAKRTSVLAEARSILDREGVPSVAKAGDAGAYGFVLVNMLGQPPNFRREFMVRLREAAAHAELPADAVIFAEARLRQGESEDLFRAGVPSEPLLRDDILRLLKADQAVREKKGFNFRKMQQADRATSMPLRAIFDRNGVPTYDMVGVEAAKGFVVMVQHQSPEFRQVVLPKLKANVDAGQGDAGNYAMVYDRTQRDQGKKQLYGEQLECSSGKSLSEAPIEDEAAVDMRRAQLGLMRIALYVRFVKLQAPDMCSVTGVLRALISSWL